MRPFWLGGVSLLFALAAGCAHSQKANTLTEAKKAAEEFHQRARWKDFRGAAELIVPELREDFENAREALNDERDLNITDYQLEDVRLSAEGNTARVTSKMSWHRLPSVTENTATVVSEFVLRDGVWFLASQDRGPFSDTLGAVAPGSRSR